ncbi:TSCPD domain-containing protein [Roseomonas sp. HF4]|uniref:TSCPD domain-containing protein n=1 Tax=Roseomonas sp. HF4 TaxID=2562313 RepID=UPI0010BF67D3|nr:TSCPD domain-containing protein [Roseomonas sp. HF4]
MAGLLGTIWDGVALRRIRIGADPDAPPRPVALPTAWEDEAAAAIAAIAPGNGPVVFPTLAEGWIRRVTMRGRRLGLIESPEEADALAAGLGELLLARRGAPGAEVWRDRREEARFVLSLPAFLDADGGFDAAGYAAAVAVGVRVLDILGQGRAPRLRLGFADLAGLLAAFRLPYGGPEARDVAAAIAALTRGAAEAESGRLAARHGALHPVALIWPSPPTATVVPGLAEAARAALDEAASSPGLRHEGCVALAPADAVEALLGAEQAGIAPAAGPLVPTRDNDGRFVLRPTRAAERAGDEAPALLGPPPPGARGAMEAAVMPFLDAAPPAPPAQAALPQAPRRAAPRPVAAPAARTWRVQVGGARVALRATEDDRGRLREIAFSLPREGAASRALLEALAEAVSLGLAHGVPLAAFVEAYAYGPGAGGAVEGDAAIRRATSVLDWAFRRLAIDYLGRTDLPDPAVEEMLPAVAGQDPPLLPLDLPVAQPPARRRRAWSHAA